MRKFFTFIIALHVLISSSFSQKLKTVKGHCGLYYYSMDDLLRQQAKEIGFYDFKPGQTIASIGAQCCNWEAAYAATSDSLHFFLEDIDSNYLNPEQASFAWSYYSQLKHSPLTSSFALVLGTEKTTNLPAHSFDKILIINSFHEFEFQQEMLIDIAQKLKPNGILYIDEILAKKSGELHRRCHKRIYLEEELISILKDNGYEYTGAVALSYLHEKAVREIFAFRKSK